MQNKPSSSGGKSRPWASRAKRGTLFAKVLIACALYGGLVFATDQANAAESYYSGAALKQLLKGKSLRLTNGGVITYANGGRYSFVHRGRTHVGVWRIRKNDVCVTFTNGNRRCDRYVRDGRSLYFENRQGGRFKVRGG